MKKSFVVEKYFFQNNGLKKYYLYILEVKWKVFILVNKEEFKQQFRNMSDEQIEYHIGLEKVRNVIEGFDREHGISEIRKLIEEIKNEKQELETQKFSRCYKIKKCNEFTSPHKYVIPVLMIKEIEDVKKKGLNELKKRKNLPKEIGLQCIIVRYVNAQ